MIRLSHFENFQSGHIGNLCFKQRQIIYVAKLELSLCSILFCKLRKFDGNYGNGELERAVLA